MQKNSNHHQKPDQPMDGKGWMTKLRTGRKGTGTVGEDGTYFVQHPARLRDLHKPNVPILVRRDARQVLEHEPDGERLLRGGGGGGSQSEWSQSQSTTITKNSSQA